MYPKTAMTGIEIPLRSSQGEDNDNSDEEKVVGISFDDLPDDCVEEILKKLKACVHRKDARLVCKFWQYLIDRDSSSECYLVNPRTTGYCNGYHQLKFCDFIQQFLYFNKKKISIRFEGADLSDTEYFWTEKGVHIIELSFEKECKEIPLGHVISKCIQLHKMCISYYTNKIIDALKSLAKKKLYNYLLNFLTIDMSLLYEKKTMKIAIRLVGLITKVFPNMRKVTLCKMNNIDGQYEELSKQFINLKYELVLSTKYDTVVFDSSSKTPISVTKVSTKNLTMSPHEYYGNLQEIKYWNVSFRLSELEMVFSQHPALQALTIVGDSLENDLTKPMENRLKYLTLCNESCKKSTLNAVFWETFQFLTTFIIDYAPHATFIKIVLNMRHLEVLNIRNWINDKCEINNEHQEVLVRHENLKKLMIPSSFLSDGTCTIYQFDNLVEITVNQHGYPGLVVRQNYDNHLLYRFQCANLKLIHFKVNKLIPELKNLMLLFPKLEEYRFCPYVPHTPITEDQLPSEFRQICPKLKVHNICEYSCITYNSLTLT